MHILLVEDERDLNRVICKKLRSEGYHVDSVFDGEEGFTYITLSTYDLILLDVMVPKIDGFSLIAKIRERKIDTPVIFLTAKDQISDRVKGLDLGANDYIVKPFAFDELLARIRVLTRQKLGTTSNELTLADLRLNMTEKIVYRNNIPLDLSAKEYRILEYMIHNSGIILTREQIEHHVWGFDYEGSSNIVDVYIRYLRKKVDTPTQSKLIHTVRGMGYILKESL